MRKAARDVTCRRGGAAIKPGRRDGVAVPMPSPSMRRRSTRSRRKLLKSPLPAITRDNAIAAAPSDVSTVGCSAFRTGAFAAAAAPAAPWRIPCSAVSCRVSSAHAEAHPEPAKRNPSARHAPPVALILASRSACCASASAPSSMELSETGRGAPCSGICALSHSADGWTWSHSMRLRAMTRRAIRSGRTHESMYML